MLCFFSSHSLFYIINNLFLFRWQNSSNASKCTNCYCYVCDVIASSCTNWEDSHCNAFPSANWDDARRVRRLVRNATNQKTKVTAAAVARAPSDSGCLCENTRHDADMLNWTWRTPQRTRVAPPTVGNPYGTYKYTVHVRCRVCKKIPPPATKKLLERNLFGSMTTTGGPNHYYSTLPLTSVSTTKFNSFLIQRRQLELKLLKNFIDDDSILRETALTGNNILGEDTTDKFCHPLWAEKNECQCCSTKGTSEEILSCLTCSDIQQERVGGFKTLHLGSIDGTLSFL